MTYDIGTIFYSEMNHSVGEIICKDGNKWIAKFYNRKKGQIAPSEISYGIAPTEHVVIGKINILNALKSNVRTAEISLENSQKQNDAKDKYRKINSNVNKTTQKIKNLTYELERLQAKQVADYSENREKQINSVLKALKRQRKLLMRFYFTNRRNTSNFSWEAEIQERKAELEFVKRV